MIANKFKSCSSILVSAKTINPRRQLGACNNGDLDTITSASGGVGDVAQSFTELNDGNTYYIENADGATDIEDIWVSNVNPTRCLFNSCTFGVSGACGTAITDPNFPLSFSASYEIIVDRSAGYTQSSYCLRCIWDKVGTGAVITHDVDNLSIEVLSYCAQNPPPLDS